MVIIDFAKLLKKIVLYFNTAISTKESINNKCKVIYALHNAKFIIFWYNMNK